MIKMQITGPQIIIFGYELISEIDKNQRYGVGFPKGQNNFFLLHNVHAEISAQKDSYAMATERSSVRGEAIGPWYFKAYWLLYVPPVLTFKNSAADYIAFMRFVWPQKKQ